MLANCNIVAFAPTLNQVRAIEFYRDKLGLELKSHDGFAATFDARGITLRVSTVPAPFHPQPFTILGWAVTDIGSTIRELQAAGVVFERDPRWRRTNWESGRCPAAARRSHGSGTRMATS